MKERYLYSLTKDDAILRLQQRGIYKLGPDDVTMETPTSSPRVSSPNHLMSPRGNPQATFKKDSKCDDEKQQALNINMIGNTMRNSSTNSDPHISQESAPSNLQTTTESATNNQKTNQEQKGPDRSEPSKTNVTQEIINRMVNQ